MSHSRRHPQEQGRAVRSSHLQRKEQQTMSDELAATPIAQFSSDLLANKFQCCFPKLSLFCLWQFLLSYLPGLSSAHSLPLHFVPPVQLRRGMTEQL